MADTITIQINDQTKAVSQKGLKKIAIFSPLKNIAFMEVEETGATELSGSVAEKMVSMILAQNKQKITVFGKNLKATGVTDTVESVLNANRGDYFFLLCTSRDAADIKAVAAWAAANEKIFITSPLHTATADEVVALSVACASDNVGIFAHRGEIDSKTDLVSDAYFDAGICGLMAPKDEGTATWALKEVNGLSVNEYEMAEESKLIDAKVNIYEKELGRAVTKYGKTTAGSYIDITRTKMWLKHRMREELSMMMFNADKVPFTDVGITMIQNAINRVLQAGIRRGMLQETDGDKKVTGVEVPRYAELLKNDIANRKLNGIKITAVLAGAIETVDLNLVITL